MEQRPAAHPTAADALAITHSLRVEGNRKLAVSPSRSKRPAVPLSRVQSEILRLLAEHSDPESYVAGSAYLTRGGARISDDIDIFHDREDRVARAAEQDAAVLAMPQCAARADILSGAGFARR